jgi:hypothetical protein
MDAMWTARSTGRTAVVDVTQSVLNELFGQPIA